MISRILQDGIEKQLFKGKAILILGPRQIGKTTLVKSIVKKFKDPTLWLNADEPDIRQMLSNVTSTRLKALFGNAQLVVIDEAQRVENIGITLKLITDSIPEVQVIATGSSAFELADKLKEPLTGRKFEYNLFALSAQELMNHNGLLEEKRLLEHRLLFGSYPEVVNNPGKEREILLSIADSVLYKDLFTLEKLKKPILLEKLLKALALQVGHEVSHHGLSKILDADKETIERYIHLLEHAFVLYRLPAFHRNLRNELSRTRKVYFFDNGIRNALISNFSPLTTRADKDPLWENYLMAERLKLLKYQGLYGNQYFWRTAQQQEIDYIEERDGVLHAFEFKFTKENARIPKTFANAYPHTFKVITSDNYETFVQPE